MGNARTAWHVLFVAALAENAPPGVDVIPEVLLSKEPLRADIAILRRKDAPRADEQAGTLRGLWPQIERECVVEFKSATRPVRAGDLAKLIGYGGQYHWLRYGEIGGAGHLLLCLVVPQLSDALTGDFASMRLELATLGGGYHRASGRPYDVLVVDLSAVVREERDELMAVFVRNAVVSLKGRRFLEEHMATSTDVPFSQLDGYDEVLERLLGTLTPEQRLAGLAPEQRLAGLAPEEQVLALSDEVLRAFPEDYLRGLPPRIRAAVRARIGRPAS
jgi:hypothetical protein